MPDLLALLPPPVMFFALGFAAGLLRADLSVPEALARALSIYLMVAIGLKGGAALASPGAAEGLWPALALGIGLSFLLPLPAFLFLRGALRIDRDTAAAISGHYGSVSVVTYAAAAGTLTTLGVAQEGFMPAILAAMETPAILTALLLARIGTGGSTGTGATSAQPRLNAGKLAHEVLLNGPVVLLLGSFLIGFLAGAPGRQQLAPFTEALFPGALCLFLLEMGLMAVRQLRAGGRGLSWGLVGFGIVMPLIGGAAGLLGAQAIGLSTGGVALMAVLSGSASYIAVPAAMRLALPRADAGVYVTLSVAVSFPFNILVGIPLWVKLAGG
ncbi:MAG: sodium-dependent bicarbonate transport family permease [Falsiroseomonas sp.]|nr:sodium-dependent bicarbonate transport family permease [Falsiroseomonas sp.]